MKLTLENDVLKTFFWSPWLVWLSGLSTILQTERLLVRFLVRAHACIVASFPGSGQGGGRGV